MKVQPLTAGPDGLLNMPPPLGSEMLPSPLTWLSTKAQFTTVGLEPKFPMPLP